MTAILAALVLSNPGPPPVRILLASVRIHSSLGHHRACLRAARVLDGRLRSVGSRRVVVAAQKRGDVLKECNRIDGGKDRLHD